MPDHYCDFCVFILWSTICSQFKCSGLFNFHRWKVKQVQFFHASKILVPKTAMIDFMYKTNIIYFYILLFFFEFPGFWALTWVKNLGHEERKKFDQIIDFTMESLSISWISMARLTCDFPRLWQAFHGFDRRVTRLSHSAWLNFEFLAHSNTR